VKIEIRKAVKSDGDVIAHFQLLMADETENIKLDERIVQKGVSAIFHKPELGQYFVAEAKGKIVASLMTTFEWSDWRNGMVWWIQSVYVLPEYRKKGIFKKIYAYIKTLVLSRDDVSGLRLYVANENASAAHVYKAVGMDGNRYRLFEWMKEF
jgi:GNAT superfamily N-acetyltransferase